MILYIFTLFSAQLQGGKVTVTLNGKDVLSEILEKRNPGYTSSSSSPDSLTSLFDVRRHRESSSEVALRDGSGGPGPEGQACSLLSGPSDKIGDDAVDVASAGHAPPLAAFESYATLFTSPSFEGDNAIEVQGHPLLPQSHPTEQFKLQNNPRPIYCRLSDRWEVCVGLSPTNSFEQFSFVNAVWTPRGGTHVQAVVQQLIGVIDEAVRKHPDANAGQDKGSSSSSSTSSSSSSTNLTNTMIRNRLMVFVRCAIENPSFDSQSKDSLTTPQHAWGSTCKLPTRFLKKIVSDSGIVDELVNDIWSKEQSRLTRAVSNKGGANKQLNIPKLDDAHWAGSEKADQCLLILTEGDRYKYKYKPLYVVYVYNIFCSHFSTYTWHHTHTHYYLRYFLINYIKLIIYNTFTYTYTYTYTYTFII